MRIIYTSIILLILSSPVLSQDRIPMPSGKDPVTRIIKFYPNPATSVINFDFQKDYDRSYSFQILNFLGKKVYEVNNVTPKTIVSLSDFYRGVYIFQLRDKNGKVVDTGKFQVSK